MYIQNILFYKCLIKLYRTCSVPPEAGLDNPDLDMGNV